MYTTAYNPGDSPVVVSADGRSIAGHEWGTVETTDSFASEALKSEYLVKQDPPESDDANHNPLATAAYAKTANYRSRQEKAQLLESDALYNLATENKLTPEVETFSDRPNKGVLVTLVVEAENITIPTAQAKKAVEKKEA